MVGALTLTALQQARKAGLIIRDFVWVEALTSGGAPVSFGFWNDIEDITTPVLDVRTGATVNRNFYGGGSLLEVGPIPQTSGLDFRNVKIKLNRSHPQVQSLLLSNNAAAAKCDIYLGVFDADTHLIVEPPTIRFSGKIDAARQTISKVGGVDYIEVTVAPTLRELTRLNPNKKSHATQTAMRPGDNWRKYEGKKVPVNWGEFQESVEPEKKSGIFGAGWWIF